MTSSLPKVPKASTSSWATVAGKKKKKKAKEQAPPPLMSSSKAGPSAGPNASPKAGAKAGPRVGPKAGRRVGPKAGFKAGHKERPKVGPKPSRLPTSAAITVTVPEDSDVTLAAVMAAAKARIKLADFGVDTVRTKRAITGGLILEVSGPDCSSKADRLAERMSVALKDLGVRVVRPVKMGELRLKDLDDSVTPQEVQTAVSTSGDCSVINVRVGDIRRSPTALGTVWVRCPLASVRKLAAAKHVVVGWVSARVDYLTSRPLQCFRCLEYGHVRSMCQGTVNRSTLCYACGKPGHRASQCTDPHRCPLCSDKGCKADHRMGSKKCTPPKGKRKPLDPAPEGKVAPTNGATQSDHRFRKLIMEKNREETPMMYMS
ncbi:hypothetical protein OBRU01_06676 [Operophtera brumata]|uniref:CCHC-type domain-containing protein n=1 Tax=Operophtera brumata TaxID=104452 RepID=A0A0L7LKX4_OPEBR|nr:hypothetical protein OBRU01_06676 [Operophtera brumata]